MRCRRRPGGIKFGLKLAFEDDVHCFFAEPTHSPCMTPGLMTGLHDKVSAQEFGIDNLIKADGLAVGRPSGLDSSMMTSMLLLDKVNQSTHIIWATGGSMVPKDMLEQYLSNS